MGKKKKLTYEEKLEKALRSLPFPLHDKKHGIEICCVNDRERSNQTRYEHILQERHGLIVPDIELIPKHINTSDLIQDKSRNKTFNLYIKRSKSLGGYVQISLEIDFNKSNIAKVKTIFVTKNMK